VGKSVAGHFGLLHPRVSKDLKGRAPLWLAEFDWESLAQLSRKASDLPAYLPWPQFPTMERDFALVVKKELAAEKLCQLAIKYGKPLAKTAKVFDIYHGIQVAEGMTSVAVRVIFYDEQRSIQEAEVEAASSRIVDGWKKELGIELRNQ
jgi:phenylalanyl-tRNA synthetase beta chain